MSTIINKLYKPLGISESTLPYDSQSATSRGSGEGGATGQAASSDQSPAAAAQSQLQPKHRNSVADSFSKPDGSLDYDQFKLKARHFGTWSRFLGTVRIITTLKHVINSFTWW
ncbi:hypothetical protein LSTR_LSTR014989 [Laodelphax striatellus]|uniref:Uncharacterized protein n=1 Tax=Laodelphax striatellus TaxID=195883 RepID=A0A482XRE5_LAOST|nr:hypothetical protein LSTR_LSTR014989 [Laodelphax striatellus]